MIKACSANEALDQLLRTDVAIVLIDVCMPDLDGFELAAMIREHPRFQKTAIIFVSAIQVTDLDLVRGYAAGAVDYVPVPIIPELWLPVSDANEDATAPPAAPRRPTRPTHLEEARSCRILVVDDDPIVATGTVAMLEDLGHVATEVPSGDAALRLLGSDTVIDLVITDHAMPGMTGTELAARIRRSWPDLPIVIASGYAELPGDGDLALPRLSKPYRQQDLAALVARLVRDRSVRRAAAGAAAQ